QALLNDVLAYVPAPALSQRALLSDEEIARFQKELSQVLDYFEMLARVDTSHISPTFHSSLLSNVMREDVTRPAQEHARTPLTRSFPDAEGGYCKTHG
ncbi:MAG: Asp-tRNA(Asn)/Glu-tRNA(Gln) amidotransferase subunit GatC, partial [Candidatus Wildermuthbacteria bacterium]|nr:Asp-tRNA(Asn)/Glu-tRNA(Gln) amidotransferase subunit GatC [Candidatus Wildermuthbacteria bacterium]